MIEFIARLTLVCLIALGAAPMISVTAAAQDTPPAWAYPVNPPDFKPPPDDGTVRQVPGSKAGYTLTQLRDRFIAPDLASRRLPGDAGDRRAGPQAGACMPADSATAPTAPAVRRTPTSPDCRSPTSFARWPTSRAARAIARCRIAPDAAQGLQLAKAITDAEIEAAATYFASIKPRSIVRVIESATAPQAVVAAWYYSGVPNGRRSRSASASSRSRRTAEQFVNRDTRARFVAYVPEGSIKRGQVLATTGGGGRTLPCGTCHGGPTMRGVGVIGLPPLAGRSPSYLVRQLYDLKHDTRNGSQGVIMKSTVKDLTIDDMIALAAYLGSLEP